MSAGQITQGRRIYPNPDGSWNKLQPGDYVHDLKGGHWFTCLPGHPELIGDLSLHSIVEHEDGTITVSPSILTGFANPKNDWERKMGSWHGFLERGVWREV